MLKDLSLGRVALYLVCAFVVWVFLSQLGGEDADETAAIRQVEHVLTGHDAYEHRMRGLQFSAREAQRASMRWRDSAHAQGEARALAETQVRESLVKGDTAGAIEHLESALAHAGTQIKSLYSGLERCDAAYHQLEAALTLCAARTDTLRAYLHHTVNLLVGRRTFHVWFVKLPRPKKWQVGLFGATIGALIDTDDRLRGASLGGFGAVLLAPTR